MGSTCCSSNTVTDNEGQLSNKVQQQLHSSTYFSQKQLRFFQEFPKMKPIVQKIFTNLPKNWLINHDAMTEIKGQGTYLGKKNTKMRAGYGIMLYDVGFYYVGCWRENCREGLGVMIDKNGSYYKGQWLLDEANGYGEYYDGENPNWFYRGKWNKGKIDEKGEEVYPDGTKYVGSYRDGSKTGIGRLIFDKNCYFQGTFDKDVVRGHGVQKGLDYKYQGPWQNYEMHGAGTVQYYDSQGNPSDIYVGQFQQGIKHGYGQYRWKDGTIYKGQWVRGNLVSRGVLIQKQ